MLSVLVRKLPSKDSIRVVPTSAICTVCLLYTSDAADERSSVDLGGRRIIKKKKEEYIGIGRDIYKKCAN